MKSLTAKSYLPSYTQYQHILTEPSDREMPNRDTIEYVSGPNVICKCIPKLYA